MCTKRTQSVFVANLTIKRQFISSHWTDNKVFWTEQSLCQIISFFYYKKFFQPNFFQKWILKSLLFSLLSWLAWLRLKICWTPAPMNQLISLPKSMEIYYSSQTAMKINNFRVISFLWKISDCIKMSTVFYIMLLEHAPAVCIHFIFFCGQLIKNDYSFFASLDVICVIL